ncbi:guanine nucleotide-binding protein subunit beta-like protein 1 [Ischnura elegans]|uniref:guanine nucleotide-binding protein subunit beta-like protein 1 n=1 Tax=Ischnura elegans TaxID=197161 RepID=UPI001ED8B52C|nr:guanine nucleotide-binding protein subunit beta-like protein 1 [Ischnura elegans]
MPRPPPGPLYTLKGDPSPVHSLHFWEKSGNEKLFAGCQSGQVQLWSLQSNRSVEGLQAHSGPCLNVACHGDNLITQGKGDGNVKSWHSLEGGGWAPSYTIHTRHSIFCRFSILQAEDGRNPMIVCPDESYSVGVYSLDTGERLAHLNFEDFTKNSKKFGYIMALKAFSDPRSQQPMLLVAHEGGQLSLRDLVNGGKEMCCLDVGEPILCLDFDPAEGVGLYGSPEGAQIKKFCVDTKNGTCELGSCTPITNPGISSIHFRPDYKIVSTGGWDSRIRIFSWQRSCKSSSQKSEVSAVDDEKEVIQGQSLDRRVAPSETLVQPSIADSIDVTSPNLHSDKVSGGSKSEKSLSPSVSNSVNMMVVPSFRKPMKPLAVLNHHTKAIQCVVYSAGRVESWESSCLLAAGSNDGGISLWDLYN